MMTATNWTTAAQFQASAPHTFNALQHLVMAMADFSKNRGKTSFFGRDKGLAAYKKFEDKLKDTLLAMVLDGIIQRDARPALARATIVDAIGLFAAAFPNWQDAYEFAEEYFIDSPAIADDRIRSALL